MASIYQQTRSMANQNFLKSYLWRVVLPDLTYNTAGMTGNGFSFGGSSSLTSGIMSFAEKEAHKAEQFAINKAESALGIKSDSTIGSLDPIGVGFRVSNVSIPMFQTSPSQVTFGNTYWQKPGNMEIGTLTLEIVETEDGKTMQYLQRWNDLMFNKNAHGNITYNPPMYFKRPVYAYHLNGMKSDLIEFKFDGAYIGSIENQSKDYESSDFFRLSVTLPVDKMSYQILTPQQVKQTELYNQTLSLRRGLNVDRTQISNEVHNFLEKHIL